MTIFGLGNRKMVPDSNQAAQSNATGKGPKKGTKGGKTSKNSPPPDALPT
jgi:hypothetical protein